MSDTSEAVTTWPSVTRMREEIAELARHAAEKRQADCGWSTEDACQRVREAAVEAAEIIGDALVSAAEMSLETWAATK